jgi:queuine tRNA-ribosyltransferase
MPNPNRFSSTLVKKHKTAAARVMKISTPHGEVLTPTFMPVGTHALVNYMTPADLIRTQSHLILGGNTYHMLIKPGLDTIEKAGGMHAFMGWKQAMLTDSGGFQVLSLSQKGGLCRIDEDGAHFKHPLSGQLTHLTPASSIKTQKAIGADIIMAFDECTPETGGREAALAALDRTHRWLLLSKEEQEKNPCSLYGLRQALFGIIQGGSFQDLREESTRFILDLDLDGIGIGGEIIGFDMKKTVEIINWIRPELPEQKIRYTMGVGLKPQDLIDVVTEGIDIFDCVAPTRNARHGSLYHGWVIEKEGRLHFDFDGDSSHILIKKSIYAKDPNPILAGCTCYTCENFSRAYLHYLFKEQKLGYAHLACIHNIHVMQNVCTRLHQWIMES